MLVQALDFCEPPLELAEKRLKAFAGDEPESVLTAMAAHGLLDLQGFFIVVPLIRDSPNFRNDCGQQLKRLFRK